MLYGDSKGWSPHKSKLPVSGLKNLVPEYVSEKFASVNTIHIHNLRGAQNNLFIPRPKTVALKKSFRHRGVVTLNSLVPDEARQATTYIVFNLLL